MLSEAEGVDSFLRYEDGCYVLNKLDNTDWWNPPNLVILRLQVAPSLRSDRCAQVTTTQSLQITKSGMTNYYIVCPKNLRILRVPPFTENTTIANEMHDLSAREVPRCRFPIAAIDNVENSCRDTVVYRKWKKCSAFFCFCDSWKFWW